MSVPAAVIPDDPRQWGFITLCVVSSSIISWAIAQKRSRKEIEKLGAETEKLRGECAKFRAEVEKLEKESISLALEILRDVQKNRREYSSAQQECKEAILGLVDKITQSRTLISGGLATMLPAILIQREKVCSLFTHKVIDAYLAYIECKCLVLAKEPAELRNFIRDDVRPELDRFVFWNEVINRPGFFKGTNITPLKLEKRSLRPFYELSLRFPSEKNFLEDTLGRSLRRLCNEPDPIR
jgi:hypothetical protein